MFEVASLGVEVQVFGSALDVLGQIDKKIEEMNGKAVDAMLTLDVQWKKGAFESLSRTLKTGLSTLSQNAFVDVDLRLKADAVQRLEEQIRGVAASASGVGSVGGGSGGGSGGSGGSGVSGGGSASSSAADAGISREQIIMGSAISREIDKANAEVTKLASQWSPVISEVQQYKLEVKQASAAEKEINADFARLDALLNSTAQQSRKFEVELEKSALAAEVLQANLNKGLHAFTGGVEKQIQRVAEEEANLGKEAENTNTWFAKSLRTILAFTTGYVVVTGLLAAVRALKDATIGYDSILQNTGVALTAQFGGNEKAAQALLDKLQQFAVLTPFKFADLVPLTVELRTAHVEADKIIPTMKALGDAATASGRDLNEAVNRMTTDLVTLSARGKVTGEDIRTFAHSGVNIVQYLAQAYSDILPKGTRAATAAMTDLIHKGLIPADKAITAIRVGIENDPMKAGLMEKQAKTFTTSLSNIADGMNRVLGHAFEPFFKSINDLAVAIGSVLSSPSFQTWAENLAARIFAAFSTIGNIVKWMAEQFADKLPYIVGILAVLGGAKIIGGIVALKSAIQSFAVSSSLGFANSTAALNKWLVAVVLFIAAYRNFHIVRDITESVAVGVLTIFKGLAVGMSWIVESMEKAFEWLINKAPVLSQQQRKILNAMGGPMAAPLQLYDDLFKRMQANQQLQHGPFINLTRDTTKYMDDLIDSFRSKKKDFDKSITDPFGGGVGGIDIKKWMAEGEAAAKAAMAGFKEVAHFTAADLNPGKEKSDKAASQAERERLKALKDMLGDNAEQWRKYGEAVKAATELEIKQLDKVLKPLEELFKNLQQHLIDIGVVSDPLGDVFRTLNDVLGLQAAKIKILTDATKEYSMAMRQARDAESRKEAADLEDANVPNKVGGLQRAADADRYRPVHIGRLRGSALAAATMSPSLPPMLVAPRIGASSIIQPPKAYHGKTVGEPGPFDAEILEAKRQLNEVYKINEGWGRAVVQKEGYEARFAAQKFLTTGAGQDMLSRLNQMLDTKDSTAKLLKLSEALGGIELKVQGKGLEHAANLVRQIFNAVDIKMNFAQLPHMLDDFDTATNKLRETQKGAIEANTAATLSIRQFGYNSVNVARILEEQKKRQEATNEITKNGTIPLVLAQGRYEKELKDRIAERLQLEMNAYDDNAAAEAFRANAEAVNNLTDQYAALNEETVQQQAYRKVYLADNAALLSDFDKMTRYSAEVQAELGKMDRAHYEAMRALGDQKDLLKFEQGLISQGLNEAPLTEQLQYQTDLQTKFLELNHHGVDGIKALGMAMEEATGQKQAKRMQDLNALWRDQAEQTRDLNDELALQAKLQQIIKTTAAGSAEREQQTFVATTMGELAKKYRGKMFGGLATINEFLNRDQSKEAGDTTKTLDAFTAATTQADNAEKAFGDVTGLASAKLALLNAELGRGSQAQKDGYLADQARIIGLQRFGQEYDSLFQQKFSIQADIERQTTQLYRDLTPLQEQELKWKYEDLETSARLAKMTDAQREAYQKQKPEVEELRNSVRGLLKDLDGFRYVQWGADFNTRVDEFKSGLGNLAGLRTDLKRHGASDAQINQAIGKEKWLQIAQQVRDGVSNTFGQMFDNIFQGGKNLWQNLEQGFAKMLEDIAKQILMSYVNKWVSSLIGGAIGAAAGAPGGASGGDAGATTNPASIGGYDGTWTGAPDTSGLTNRISTRGLTTPPAGGGSVTVVNHYYNVGSVVANNPDQFRKRLPGREMSRGMTQYKIDQSLATRQ